MNQAKEEIRKQINRLTSFIREQKRDIKDKEEDLKEMREEMEDNKQLRKEFEDLLESANEE